MYQNAAKNLTNIFNTAEGFKKDFGECVFDFDDEEDFLETWEKMLEKYNLRDNEWLKRLFKEKDKWALVYGHDTFCADMKSTQRSERMNRTLKDYLHVTHDLIRFFYHFQRMLDDLRNKELESDFMSFQSAMPLYYPLVKLKVASKFYTHAVFQDFVKEVLKSLNLKVDGVVEDDNVVKYTIKNVETHRTHVVLFNLESNIASCRCRKFEFIGIICCHSLKVYERRDITEIPSSYLLKRWSKDAKSRIEIVMPQYGGEEDTIENVGRRYHLLTRKAIKLSARAAESKETFIYIDQVMDKVVQEVESRLKIKMIGETCTNPNTSQDASQQSFDVGCSSQVPCDVNIQSIKGFKQKENKKRGAKIKPSCLERCQGTKKKKTKNSQEHNFIQTPQTISCTTNPTCPLPSHEHSSPMPSESIGVQVQSPSDMQREIERLKGLVMEMQKNQVGNVQVG